MKYIPVGVVEEQIQMLLATREVVKGYPKREIAVNYALHILRNVNASAWM